MKLWRGLAASLILAAIVLAGCAQNTETPMGVQQASAQRSATPTVIRIRVDPWNGPGQRNGGGDADPGQADATYASATETGTQGGKGRPATYSQYVTVWIDTSSTGSAGGTATGSAAGSQTTAPVQETKPAINLSLAPAVGTSPRVTIDQVAAAEGAAAGGAKTTDQSGATTATTIRAIQDRIAGILEWLQAAQSTTQPGG